MNISIPTPAAAPAAGDGESLVRPSLTQLALYFLNLGTTGFGGPIALAGAMQRDLVERRRWFSEADYREGLALAQLAPGPLAAQLAIYLGWARAGVLGATVVAAAFVLPSFLMVLVLSYAYVRLGGLPWMRGAFYGIGAAVIAIIARSATKLTRLTLARDRLLWAIFALNAATTAWFEAELAWVILLCGLLVAAARAPRWGGAAAASWWLAPLPAWLAGGLQGAAAPATLATIGLYFAGAGSMVFGSGLAIVPFLYGGVVERYEWLNEQQFLDAVAVAMITPGPVVITVAFIGYLVAGPAGAVLAALGVFLPCYLFTIIPAPYFRRISQNRWLRQFVDGVTAAATGAIAGSVVVLGRRAIIDPASAAIAVVTFVILWRFRKLPEPLLIVAAGALGIAIGSPGP